MNHVTLRVSDVSRSKEFYQKLLGVPTRPGRQVGTVLVLGESTVALAAARDRKPGIDHFCIGVEGFSSVGAAIEKLRRAGLNPEQPYGPDEVYVRDPESNLVQVAPPDYARSAAPLAAAPPGAPFRATSLNHVTVHVSDLKRAKNFYQNLFGGSPRRENQAGLNLGLGSTFLGLDASADRPVGMDHFCIGIADYNVAIVAEKLKQRRLERVALYSDQQVYFRDPDGILVQLAGADYRG